MATTRSFRLEVEQPILDDLQMRLARARRTAIGANPDWSHGTSPSFLSELLAYWRGPFNWREQEAKLNAFTQATVDLGSGPLHFVHQRSTSATGVLPMPLLLLHGWPDSFYRFHKVIRPLAANGFEVVVPSLPGFPLSEKVRFASEHQVNRQTAQLLWRLMTEVLGYSRFAVAGGDGGSPIAQLIAIDHPESIIGVHLTDLGWQATAFDQSTATAEEKKYIAHAGKTFMADGAYAAVQSTKPRSLAPALNDSPVALASWLVDRFHSWSDSGGDVEKSFSKDELLTNITLYWVTEAIGSSIFSYFSESKSQSLGTNDHVSSPTALALFPKDISGVPPRSIAERMVNLQRWTEMPRGSHFPAWEEPDLFTDDVTAFFQTLRPTPFVPPQGDTHAATATV